MTPIQSLALGFAALASLGGVALSLPISTESGTGQSFLDALFSATSAVTTTGLIVVDTGAFYSTFGEVVLLLLVQVGGLGYMVFVVLVWTVFKKSLSFTATTMMSQSVAGTSRRRIRQMALAVLLTTVIVETLGTAGFVARFAADYPFGRALWLGLFHSVSTFCTAGFSLFSDSFIGYRDDTWLCVLIAGVSFAGAIGFYVINDLVRWGRKRARGQYPLRTTEHTHLALSVATLLMLAGTVFLLFSEPHAPVWEEDLKTASFQAISAATTTGFNSVDVGAMSNGGLFLLTLLMFVGASPGGTGGGIKTIAFGISVASVWAFLHGRERVTVWRRHVPAEAQRLSSSVVLLTATWVIASTLLLCLTESTDFIKALFEVTSAFGTVGLSAGITSGLSEVGKVVIIGTMFAGRVGVASVGMSVVRQRGDTAYRFADGDFYVG
jgi:trk system potassium uptake protein TrkH